MPQVIKKEDGTEETVYSQAELDQMAKQKADEAAAAERTRLEAEGATEREKLQKDLDTATEELKKLQGKDFNFEKLRQTNEEKIKAETELKKTIENLAARIDQIAAAPIAQAKKNFITAQFGTDQEAIKKFEVHYAKVGRDAKTDEEVQAALLEAHLLTTGGAKPKPDSSGRMMGTGPDSGTSHVEGEETQDSREFRQEFHITDDDKKKHDPKNKTNLF